MYRSLAVRLRLCRSCRCRFCLCRGDDVLNSFVELLFFLRLEWTMVLIAADVPVGGPAENRSVLVLFWPREVTQVPLVVIHDVVNHLLGSDTALVVW